MTQEEIDKVPKEIIFNADTNEFVLTIDLNSMTFKENASELEVVRYLKGVLNSKGRFMDRFVNRLREVQEKTRERLIEFDKGVQDHHKFILDYFNPEPLVQRCLDLWDDAKPFTYKETFELTDTDFQSKVFSSIDIINMIEELGHERVAVAGKPVTHKKFDAEGNLTGTEEYDVIYETHKVNAKTLGVVEDSYALRCWCTTTEDEHWLWIEEQYKDDPLEAVASTFRIHKNLIDNIKEIKRQGDILIVEMKDDNIEPKGEIIPLTANQYFSLLTAQT